MDACRHRVKGGRRNTQEAELDSVKTGWQGDLSGRKYMFFFPHLSSATRDQLQETSDSFWNWTVDLGEGTAGPS